MSALRQSAVSFGAKLSSHMLSHQKLMQSVLLFGLTQLQHVSWVDFFFYAATVYPLCVICSGRGFFLLVFNAVSCKGGAATFVRFRTTHNAQDGTLGFR